MEGVDMIWIKFIPETSEIALYVNKINKIPYVGTITRSEWELQGCE